MVLPESDQTAVDRDQNASDRDHRAEAHDQASEDRDDRAQARDERAEVREEASDEIATGAPADRAAARRDRRGGAADRIQAADDRDAASVDRVLAARERAASSIDGLTRAHRREPGTVELEREIARATRTKQPFVLAFVDVDHLKETNDSRGHTAGDHLLRAAAESIRAHLRSYDLVVRFGGDEFVCGLPDLSLTVAAERFSAVNADLAAISPNASVSFGLAELRPGDALADLIARADKALYKDRKQVRQAPARRPRRKAAVAK